MEVLLNCCCGLDVHKDKIEGCILKNAERTAIRQTFGCISSELDRLCKWLCEYECLYVAMESTGVYWEPIYDRIQKKCPDMKELMIVNAHHMRNLPGRKTDIKDAEWITQLLQHGLLSNSFIPEKTVRTMRELSRQRRQFVREHSTYSNRIEKFLQRHGFKLSSVVSSIMGVSGQRILYMLTDKGELSIEDVRACCHHSLKKAPEEIHRAIIGCLNETECKMLKMLIRWCEQIKAQIHELDSLLAASSAEYTSQIQLVTGIPGVSNDSALEILSEISPTPQNDFDSAEKLCSWAGLVPRNDESAGVIKSRKILHGNPYVKSILVQCAWAAVKTRNSEFNRWFWARQGRMGRKKAIIAVARKILSRIYTLLQSGELYKAPDFAVIPATS